MSELPVASRGLDRRASVRYPCSEDGFGLDNSCRPIGTECKEAWAASIRDLSTGGIGLVVNRRFEPGALLVVELQDTEQTTTRTLLVRVVRAMKEDKTAWLLGCEFIYKMTEAELLALM
jgi:hypothetical protein